MEATCGRDSSAVNTDSRFIFVANNTLIGLLNLVSYQIETGLIRCSGEASAACVVLETIVFSPWLANLSV